MTGFRAFLPEARRCGIAALVLLAGFYGLRWTANLVPETRSFAFIEQAFDAGVLGYPTFPNSVKRRGGGSDCSLLRSMVTPPSAGLAEALAPSSLHLRVPKRRNKWTDQCRMLFEIVKGPERQPSIRTLKPRYWHGSLAVFATLLHVPTLNFRQITETFTAAKYFAWMLLAVLAFAHSRRLFAVLAPVIVTGVFASAIPYYSSISYGFPYLFAVLALAGLVRLMAVRAPASVLRLCSFAAGMGSSFLFLLDGHLILLLPMALVILHFGREDADLREWAVLAAGCLGAFAAGFTLSCFVDQAGKVAVLGWDGVAPGFFDSLALRLSSTLSDGQHTSAAKAIARVFSRGYPESGFMGNVLFAKAFTAACGIAFLAGAVAAAHRAWRAGRIAPAAGFIVIIAAIGLVAVRLGILPNHTFLHQGIIGRYMFVPLALAVSGLIALRAWRPASPPRPPSVSGGPGPRRQAPRTGG